MWGGQMQATDGEGMQATPEGRAMQATMEGWAMQATPQATPDATLTPFLRGGDDAGHTGGKGHN